MIRKLIRVNYMNRMKNILLVLLFLLIICGLLFFIFRPAYVQFSGYGVQIKTDGTLMLERQITFQGWHLSPLFGQETIKVTRLSVDGFPYSLARQDASPVFPRTDGVCFADCVLLTPDNVPVNCDFMWADSEAFCLIHMDGYFFICGKNGEYQEILDRYLDLISIPR